MAYQVNFSDPEKAPFTVGTGGIDGPGQSQQNSDVYIFGPGRLNFGEAANENVLHLLENFAHPEASPNIPNASVLAHPIEGQLWFNSTSKNLMLFNGTSWVATKGAVASGTAPGGTRQLGDLWYDTNLLQLKVWNGTSFEISSSSSLSLDGSLPMAGPFNMGNNIINNLNGPVLPTDAANKQYVDSTVASSASANALIVKLSDNSLSVANVKKLNLDVGDFTLSNLGSGEVSIGVTAAGGGSISVTDGTTTVNPTTSISFVSGGALDVDNMGGGVARVTIPTGGAGSLTVREADGSPSVASVSTLEVAGAVVTTPSSGIARITLPTASMTVKESDGTPTLTGIDTLSFTGATVTSGSGSTAVIAVTGGGSLTVTRQTAAGDLTPVTGVNTLKFRHAQFDSSTPGTVAIKTGVQVDYTAINNATTSLDAVDALQLGNAFENVFDPNVQTSTIKLRLRESDTNGFTPGSNVTGTLYRRTIGNMVFCRIDVQRIGFTVLGAGQVIGTMSIIADIGKNNLQPNASFFRPSGIITVCVPNDATNNEGATILSINALTNQIRMVAHSGNTPSNQPGAVTAIRGEFWYPGIG